MTLETFKEIVRLEQKQRQLLLDCHKTGIDLYNFLESAHKQITLLMREVFGNEMSEIIEWYIYEYGEKVFRSSKTKKIVEDFRGEKGLDNLYKYITKYKK